ncbi:MAG TPA: hypothetical protein VEB43_05275 [Anaeromyxobacter sp.]|nr:hypothetical protein [Anaeromyxobacter sp.]
MTWRSSIFSSETLRAGGFRPWAALLALVVLGAGNLVAWAAQRAGRLTTSVPRQLLDERRVMLAREPGLWFLGNSTMASALSEEVLHDRLGRGWVKAPLGSSTLGVSLKLAERALTDAPSPPAAIVLFATKDDVNVNGDRARVSRRYERALEGRSLAEIAAAAIPAYACRFAIQAELLNGLAGLLPGRASAAGVEARVPARDLSAEFELTHLHKQGRAYAPGPVDFGRLAAAARGRTRLVLVFPPVTAAVERWQARHAPAHPWRKVAADLAARARAEGFEVLDYTNRYPSTTAFFEDVYHLNARGADAFTPVLLQDLGVPVPCRSAAVTGSDPRPSP